MLDKLTLPSNSFYNIIFFWTKSWMTKSVIANWTNSSIFNIFLFLVRYTNKLSHFFYFIFIVFPPLNTSTILFRLTCSSISYIKYSITSNNFIISSLPSSNFDLLTIWLIQLLHILHTGDFILFDHTWYCQINCQWHSYYKLQ